MRSFAEKQNQPQRRASSSLARRATTAPEQGSADRILSLQRTIGNQAVQRMLRPTVQRACACGGKCPKCQKKQAAQEQEMPLQRAPQDATTPEEQTAPASEAAPEEKATPDPEMDAILAAIAAIPVKKSSRDGDTEADYKKLVENGKYCRDDERTGALHPGQQCYREVPLGSGYPGGKQACFSKKTGKFVEDSPDYVAAVSGQKADGTCDISMGGDMVLSLLTSWRPERRRRFLRALGHAGADIFTEDAHLVGLGFGAFAGLSMGIALPKDGLDSPGLGTVLIPALLGFLSSQLASGGLRSLKDVTRRHGFLPTVSLSGGLSGSSDTGLSGGGMKLGFGYEKRNRPLPIIPINSYLTLGMDSSLTWHGGSDMRSTFLAKVGVRMDPGKQGGIFALGSVGAGLSAGNDLSGVTSKEVGVGYRATEFLDFQVVREEVSGGDDATYWLTVKVVAPRAALKPHKKEPRPED